jgi:hypothetical protein
MIQYNIYQTDGNYRFMWWDAVKDEFSLDDYKRVYSGKLPDDTMDDQEILEEMYTKFNVNRPDDYRARSVSVSDVIELIRDGTSKYYYCDNMGWKLIKEVDK